MRGYCGGGSHHWLRRGWVCSATVRHGSLCYGWLRRGRAWAVNGIERAPSGALSVSAGRALGFDAARLMVESRPFHSFCGEQWMRILGILALVVGAVLLISALAMDTTVGTTSGDRVNNIGLIAAREQRTIIAGIALIIGVLLVVLGKRKVLTPTPSVAFDTRSCPYCAETIKCAAVKCRFCGADVEAIPAPNRPPPLTHGWTVNIACKPGEEFDGRLAKLEELKLPIFSSAESTIVVGPYAEKKKADSVKRRLSAVHYMHGELDWIERK